MRIVVQDERCSGHGRCYSVVPELFGSDDQGFPLGRGTPVEVPTDKAEAAQLAVSSCPEGAIEVLEA